jgi:hypothetical protein
MKFTKKILRGLRGKIKIHPVVRSKILDTIEIHMGQAFSLKPPSEVRIILGNAKRASKFLDFLWCFSQPKIKANPKSPSVYNSAKK